MSGTVEQGVENAIRVCLRVGPADRVVIIGDRQTAGIAEALAKEARKVPAPTTLLMLEDYGRRPFTAVPPALASDLCLLKPRVSLFAAQGQPGEIAFRLQLGPILQHELKTRHGHMIGIDERLMREGMCADYRRVAETTRRVYEAVKTARQIRVTSGKGSDFTVDLSPELAWKPCPGLYHQQGDWGNLPEGELFTSPVDANGIIVVDVIGDYFSEKYGLLDSPVKLSVRGSRVRDVSCASAALEAELRSYLASVENGDRMGEFAIGSNVFLDHLTGNLLQDEKYPGVHVAFGYPYPDETGANWTSSVHVDVIPTQCSIVADGKTIMTEGRFAEELLR